MPDPIIPPQPAAAPKPDAAATPAAAPAAAAPAGVQPLSGSTTIDDKVAIEAQILTCEAIGRIARQIGEEFHEKYPAVEEKRYCVVLLDDSIAPALAAYQGFLLNTAILSDSFTRIIHGAAPKEKQPEHVATEVKAMMEAAEVQATMEAAGVSEAISAAAVLGRSVVDLLSLFRQNTAYSGRTYTVKDTAVAFELARWLRDGRDDVTVIYPKLMLYGPQRPPSDSLRLSLRHLVELRDRAEQALRKVSKDVLDLELQIRPPQPLPQPEPEAVERLTRELIEKKTLQDGIRQLFEASDAKLQALASEWNRPDASGVSTLQNIEKAEQIMARFQEAKTTTLFLSAEILAAGGAYRIRSSLWRTLFNSDGLSYTGGAAIAFAFVNGSAEIVLSGVRRYRTPFTRFKEEIYRGAEPEEESRPRKDPPGREYRKG